MRPHMLKAVVGVEDIAAGMLGGNFPACWLEHVARCGIDEAIGAAALSFSVEDDADILSQSLDLERALRPLIAVAGEIIRADGVAAFDEGGERILKTVLIDHIAPLGVGARLHAGRLGQ